jgi:hypothetical protein
LKNSSQENERPRYSSENNQYNLISNVLSRVAHTEENEIMNENVAKWDSTPVDEDLNTISGKKKRSNNDFQCSK